MYRMALRTIIYILCLVLFASCDLFDPRTPEEPTAARGNFIPPTTPEIVIENFINAINERNAQHYMQCLIDETISEKEFEFVPTQGAQGQFPALFDEWTRINERRYLDNLISSIPDNATLSVQFEGIHWESPSSFEASFRASYRLIANHTNDSFPHYVFEGTLQFELTTDQTNNWAIFHWTDFALDDKMSWSELKGTFNL